MSAITILRQQGVDTTHVDGVMYCEGKSPYVGHQHLVRKTHLTCRPSGIVVTDPAWQASAFKERHANSALQP